MAIRTLFVSKLYEASLSGEPGFDPADLAQACRAIAAQDKAGQAWCRDHAYGGYTSYASLNDLTSRDSLFDDLRRRLDKHLAAFARDLHLDLGKRLKLDSLWINILKPGAAHSGHIHPHSVISGTLYVEIPKGSGSIAFEDPRLPLMMAAPPRENVTPEELRTVVTVEPKAGTLLLWESWLRHEVLAGKGRGHRLSISFNFA